MFSNKERLPATQKYLSEGIKEDFWFVDIENFRILEENKSYIAFSFRTGSLDINGDVFLNQKGTSLRSRARIKKGNQLTDILIAMKGELPLSLYVMDNALLFKSDGVYAWTMQDEYFIKLSPFSQKVDPSLRGSGRYPFPVFNISYEYGLLTFRLGDSNPTPISINEKLSFSDFEACLEESNSSRILSVKEISSDLETILTVPKQLMLSSYYDFLIGEGGDWANFFSKFSDNLCLSRVKSIS